MLETTMILQFLNNFLYLFTCFFLMIGILRISFQGVTANSFPFR